MTKTQEQQFVRMYKFLKDITLYQSVERLRKSSEKEWGLPFEEAIEMAYENIQETAKQAIRGVRLPKES